MPVELIFDMILALLLVTAIAGGWMLNQRLQIIREGQKELAALVQQLNEATGRAQSSVHELKQAGSAVEEDLRAEIGKARALADELALITEAGDNLAGRLEKRLTGSAEESRQARAKSGGEQDSAESPDRPDRSNSAGDEENTEFGDPAIEGLSEEDEAEFLQALKEAR